ncbi:MAG: methyltransferase domain-containing protein [Pseudomonadota bacterium]
MIQYYVALLDEPHRLEAFDKAISAAVRPDDVVVDLGCGVGTFAIFAARAGARRVIGVESSPVIECARQVVRDNGLDIELIAGDAFDIRLPERATYLIFEDFSTTFLSDGTRRLYDSIIKHWMADEFRVFPQRLTLNAVPVAGTSIRRDVDPWHDGGLSDYGIDFSSIRTVSYNTLHNISNDLDVEMLAAPTQLIDHELGTSIPDHWEGKLVYEIDKSGALEGLSLWHNLVLDESSTYSNLPGTNESKTWGQALFPLSEPWQVAVGDRLECELQYQPGAGDGLWRWSFELFSPDGESRRQCTANSFAGLPMSRQFLAEMRKDPVAALTPEAEREACVLSLADGKRTVNELAEEFARLFPDVPSPRTVVADILGGRLRS